MIIELIADNVRKTRNPFGVPKVLLNTWYRDEGIPAAGDTMLFTGLMYQFMPYIEATTHYLEDYEDTEVVEKITSHRLMAEYRKFSAFLPNMVGGAGLFLFVRLTARAHKQQSDGVLKTIAGLLRKSRVDLFYRPDLDEYSGVLLYDLGDQEGFVRHAKKVAKKLQKAGIRRLVTVDPHTTYALKVLYPKYTGVQFEVRTYFEMLSLKSVNGHRKVTLHDPCFYGRYLELSDAPRKLLAGLNIECAEVRNKGLFTQCCGGPAESLSPRLSREVMERRMDELTGTGAPVVAMCPICYGNLKKSGENVQDLATLIAECV
jgi:Fe-S oxidoreductase